MPLHAATVSNVIIILSSNFVSNTLKLLNINANYFYTKSKAMHLFSVNLLQIANCIFCRRDNAFVISFQVQWAKLSTTIGAWPHKNLTCIFWLNSSTCNVNLGHTFLQKQIQIFFFNVKQ
jgi:hypothetical protein